MAASQLLAAAVAAAVFLAALLVPPARCQQQQVATPPPASATPPVRLPPSAPPPLVGVPPGVLMARIDAVRDELAAEVQAKYGFCMANVQEDFTQAFSFSNASFVSDCMEETQGQMTGMLCGKAEIEIYVKSLGKKPSTRGITVQQQPKNLTVLRGTIAVKAPQRNISVFGKTHVILSVVLLLVYNCSDQFIKIRAKILSKSRRKAATIAQESATARGRWKLAKELVLSHELEMSESDQLAASSNEARHATEGNGKRSKNRKKLAHARTERFRRAYSQIGRERVLQPDNDKITLSGVVALAAENRSRRPMFEVVFKGLTLSIGKKKLLQCVTGKLSPGRVTAIMGPSGAGKTTFLNAVLGKTTGYKKDGLVLINGKSGSMQSYKKIIGFVPQDDIVHGNLTVEENLWFSACCSLKFSFANPHPWSSKGMSKSDKIIVLERVIGSLGLQEIRNSLVGTVEKRGISGGQRKRVNVGIEMVMEPSLLILDEPTTGLDSASSQLLLRALRHEALQGVNVCAVIHQPSYTLFNMFDDFVLLARGGLIAYLGPISEVETYFSSLGIKVPERENPPDYYIDILEGITKTKMRGHAAPKHLPLLWMLRNGYEVPEYMQKDLEDINNVHELYTVGSMSREESFGDQSENADSVHQNVREPYSLLDRKTPGVLAQYKYYLGRVTKQRLREATLQAVDYLILCIAGICIGTIAKVKDDTFGVASYGYTIIAVSLLCQLAALRSFSPERLQYWRERESGMSTLAYFLARDTIDHFNTLVKPVAFLSTFYFFNNPRSEFKDNYLVFLALVYCVTGIGYTFAIWFELGLAQLCSALIPVVLVLVGTQPNIPNFIKGLCYPKWALEALIIAGAKKYSGVWLITRCGALLKGGYDINNFVLCIVIVMLMGVLFRFIALLSLLKLK
ncbi:Os10g0442900 [Oryza sativa Japonica Group]|nr:Os10g0442900 [Oryza sativa Japonica Group]|eukprot:NP_001064701.1 Os10g0442900 [Oryza sativa Japonica Group]